jgi:hypothetical protein
MNVRRLPEDESLGTPKSIEVRLLQSKALAKPANEANPAGVQGGARLT